MNVKEIRKNRHEERLLREEFEEEMNTSLIDSASILDETVNQKYIKWLESKIKFKKQNSIYGIFTH